MVAIISRGSMGLGGSTAGRAVALSQRRWFVAHFTGATVGADPIAVWRAIDNFHRNTNRWAVIGYNFGVARDGRILEGVGLNVRGIHSPPRNTDGFGVCFLVSPGEQMPQAMRNSGRALYDWLNRQTGRTLGRAGHRTHHPTECPGGIVYSWVNAGMPATGGAAPPPAPPPAPGGVPAFPGRILMQPPIMRGEDVRTWQNRVRARPDLPDIAADGAYGPISEGACRQVQQIARLAVDGRVGPNTWPATWTTGAGAVGGGGLEDAMTAVAWWPPGQAERETHRVFRRNDGAIMYSRDGGAWSQPMASARARGGVSIACSPNGWRIISYINTGGRACELRSAPGGRPWTWHDIGGPA